MAFIALRPTMSAPSKRKAGRWWGLFGPNSGSDREHHVETDPISLSIRAPSEARKCPTGKRFMIGVASSLTETRSSRKSLVDKHTLPGETGTHITEII